MPPASALASTSYTLIHTAAPGGITGNFSSVNIGGATSPVDYLTVAGGISANAQDYDIGFGLTWLAGAVNGSGTFTLVNPTDSFNVDVALGNQAPSATGWDGTSLTKAGAGTLLLSAVNSYTGATNVNGGILRTGIANSFATSSAVNIAAAGTLDLNGFAQTANNLAGAGAVTLGGAALTANNTALSEFSGGISGAGGLVKTGTSTLALSGVNSYTGGTTINGGTLQIGNGGTTGSITGNVTDNAGGTLAFSRSDAVTFAGVLSGAGALVQTGGTGGTGNTTLTGVGSSIGSVNVTGGTLHLGQAGVFTTAGAYTTAAGATTSIDDAATLSVGGAVTQAAGSTLTVELGNFQPTITAGTASLNGALVITDFTATPPTSASAVLASTIDLIHTAAPDGITGNFSSVSLGATNTLDYLTLGGRVSADAQDYEIGYGLAWLAGATAGNGTFTLAAGNSFNVDIALANQGPSATGWTGQSLTKAGAGTLVLSAANTYTGATNVTAGTLQAGIANAFAASNAVNVAGGATLDLNGFAQTANQLSGAGSVTLGGAPLTANNDTASSFGGVISGNGGLVKTGGTTLTLTGANTYAGGTTISAGTLELDTGSSIAGNVLDNGTLAFNRTDTTTFAGVLSGTGAVTKAGTGTTTLTGAGSSIGSVSVAGGTLSLDQVGVLTTAGNYGTAAGATTFIADAATLNVGGIFTQAAGSTLSVELGTFQPTVSAASAVLGGTLDISGFAASAPHSASALTTSSVNLIHTTGGITGDFSAVSLGGASSNLDFLTLGGDVSANGQDYNIGFSLTWLEGAVNGNGTFTLAGATDLFNVDVPLGNQVASATGWNGQSLTKEGAGTLALSAVNSYTGATNINAGTLLTGVANTFATSSAINLGASATLNLNGFDQIANNLAGAGFVTLGSAALTINETVATTFGGSISGTGSVVKTGAGTLTLTSGNTYSGGTTIGAGTLQVGNGGTVGSIAGNVLDNGTLSFNRSDAISYAGVLSGSGALVQTGGTGGAGVTTLTGAGSSVGSVNVSGGDLVLAQNGALTTTGNYTTAGGATTTVDDLATLHVGGIFTQAAGSTLQVELGNIEPTVTAGSAALNGTLDITDFTATAPTSASQAASSRINLIHTAAPGGITGNFSAVSLGATNSLDYLTLGGSVTTNTQDYDIGYSLTWLAGATTGNGTFILAAPTDTFNVDVALGNQAPSATGWNGQSLTKAGAGTLLLSAANTYTGATNVDAGTLRAGIDNAFATSNAVDVAAGATLDLNNFAQTANNLAGAGGVTLGSATLTANNTADTEFSGVVSGTTGGVTKTGIGTLTLSGANTYTGATTINAGTLQVGNGGTSGSIAGNVTDNGTLSFDRADATTYAGVISGSGVLNQAGAGNLALTGNSATFAGTTNVTAGRLQVDGTLGNAASTLSVSNGAALGGRGSIGGNVAIADGILSPGDSPGTLTIAGNLTLASTSILDYELGQSNVAGGTLNDLTVVGGNLTLDGTLNVTTAAGGSYGAGLYRLFTYGGTLTDNGLVIGSMPAGSTSFVQTSVANQVNLFNTAGLTLNYWDGTGPAFNSVINGGSGTWQASAGNNSWTDSTGVVNAAYTDGAFAIFAGAPGTVTVDDSLGAVTSGGMQFATSGYQVVGGAITLSPGQDAIRVGDGSAAGAGYAATIAAPLQGTGGVAKTDLGTLVLTGANTYTGGTTISGGVLQLGNGGTTGSLAGDVVDNASLVFDRSDVATFTGAISGTGSVTQAGSGTLVLAANSSYTGGTTISSGAVQVGNGGTTGAIVGNVVDNGTLSFNRSDAATFAGAVSGAGVLVQAGSGSTVLTGANSYTGGTVISAGTLQLGNGGTTGSIVGNVVDNGALVIDHSGALALAGTLSGTGTLTQGGSGSTTLTGTGSSVGSVAVAGGTLNLAQAGAFSTSGGYSTAAGATTSIAANATLAAGGVFTEAAGSTLAVALGSAQPVVSATSANLNGALDITGFSATAPSSASALAGTVFDVIHTSAPGGITGNFRVVSLGATNSLDYLTLAGGVSATGQDYTVGFGLTWLAGATAGNGIFTLANAGDSFNVDVALNNQVASATGWNGQTLTKNGAGTLTLSAVNGYTGATDVNAGTLRTGIANAFAASSGVDVAAGAVLDLNGFNQTANELTGAGSVTLGSAALTVDDASASTFNGVISGSGSLTKAGTATLTLTGANTYTGGTVIAAGTLQLGNGGAGGSIAGNVVDNGALVIDRSDAPVLAGVISGSGSLTQAGSGITALTGSNSYSGGTTISAGTLQIGAGGTSGSIVGDVLDNGQLAFNRSDSSSYGGAVSGSGSLAQVGSGTTTLTGASSYTGGTVVAAGTLQLGAGGSTGSIVGNVVDNGTLAFDRADVVVFNGVVSGSGALNQAGSGGTILTAANSYTGGTTVSNGTLQIGNGGTTGSIVGNVTDNGTLAFNRADAATFGGTVSGAGSLAQIGTGSTILTGSNSYTGGTLINAGTLQLGNGGVGGSIVGSVVDNGTLVFDRADAATFAGTISGSGVIEHLSSGGTLLSGNSGGFAGTTNVASGVLRVDGALGNAASTVNVATGGVLAGQGTVGGNVNVADGVLAPSAAGSISTLNIGGNLSLSSASSLNFAFGQANMVGGTLNDLVAVGGNLTLDGTINVTAPAGGSFGPGLYRIMSYGGSLTDNGLLLGVTPASLAIYVQTGFAGQVNLVNGTGLAIDYWDGGGASFNGRIDGGSGVWQASAGNGNWADSSGAVNGSYSDGAFAIFGGAPGTVTVDNGLGQVTSSGMQFATSGYLVTGGPIALLAGSNVIRVGDGTAAGEGFVATIDSAMTGAGGIDKADFGKLVLTGANTYAGGTTISGGILQLGNGGNSGSVTGDIVDNASLVLDRADTLQLDGAISGSGTLQQIGGGTTVLTAANSYSGGTTISAGTLQLGNGGSTGSIAGDVTDNGTLAFDRSDASSFPGTISGSGMVAQVGSGSVTLTGSNSYSGGTTISAGTLVGSVTSFGSGAITDNAALVIDQPSDASFANAINGSGSFTKSGVGALDLTGNSGLTGTTTVAQGLLSVNGSLARSAVQVMSGATLGGYGTVGATTVNSGGTIALGSSIGTLTVNGNFVQAGGSTYLAQVNPNSTASDLIKVSGSATLQSGAVLDVQKVTPGAYSLNSRYTVLTAADGVSGRYTLTGDISGAFFNLVDSYDANNVYLTPDQVRSFVTAAQTNNQISLARALQSLPDGNPLKVAVGLLATDAEARDAFNQLSGELHASIKSQLIEDSHYVRDAAGDRVRQALCAVGGSDSRTGAQAIGRDPAQLAPSDCNPDAPVVWARAFGSWGSIAGDDEAARLTHSIGGLFAGTDVRVGDDWRVGALAGYSRSSFDVSDRNSSGTSDNYDVGLYGGKQWGNLGLRLGTSYTWHSIDTQRSVLFPGYADQLSGRYDAGTAQAFGELGWRIDAGRMQLEPFASLAYVRESTDDFTERGGFAALTGRNASTGTTFSTLGLRASSSVEIGSTDARVHGTLGWRHAAGDVSSSTTLNFAGSSEFTTSGVPIARDAAVVELGIQAPVAKNAMLDVSYGGQFGSGVRNNGISASLNWKF